MLDGKKVRQARLDLGLSQHELGDFAGVTGVAIGNVELEKATVKLMTAKKIAERLGVTIDYLLKD